MLRPLWPAPSRPAPPFTATSSSAPSSPAPSSPAPSSPAPSSPALSSPAPSSPAPSSPAPSSSGHLSSVPASSALVPSAPSRRRVRHRLLCTVALTAIGLLAGAGVAAAHVTVNPSVAAAGDYTKLSFRVPNESATTGTVAVTVTIPADHPFASVAVQRIPGWTVVPTKTTLPSPVTDADLTIKEAVTSITWTADLGTMIGPGEFAEFDISAGPVPDVGSLEFPTTQTYSDGTVVQWNEPTPPSGEEPEHPVPTLTVGAPTGDASDGHSDDAQTQTADTSSQASVTAAASTSPTSDSGSTTPTILAAVSLIVAASALLVAAIALRRRSAPPGPRDGESR